MHGTPEMVADTAVAADTDEETPHSKGETTTKYDKADNQTNGKDS